MSEFPMTSLAKPKRLDMSLNSRYQSNTVTEVTDKLKIGLKHRTLLQITEARYKIDRFNNTIDL
jgi:hypothetical protein